MMTQEDQMRDAAADGVFLEIGKVSMSWLSSFVTQRGDPRLSERVVIERLLHYFRRLQDQEQENILLGLTRPFSRIGEAIEVLPATASVFKSTRHP